MAPHLPLVPLVALVASLAISVSPSPLSLSVETLIQKGDVFLQDCDLNSDCTRGVTQFKVKEAQDSLPDASEWSSLGLNPKNLHVNGIAIGFAPAFKSTNNPNTAAEINDKLPKSMAIVGDYYALDWWNLDMDDLKWHHQEIMRLDGSPVWCLALQPTGGLDMINYAVARKIALKMKEFNDQGTTIWLRFAPEMNGNWNKWGMQPQKFIRTWKLLMKVVKDIAPRTYSFWSPNAAFGDSVNDIRGGYTPYFPGAELIDMVGLSLYHWGRRELRVNRSPDPAEAVQKLNEFAMMYGPGGWGKPVVVGETAASYTYYQGSKVPVEGGDSEFQIKMKWLHLLFDSYITATVPGLKAVIWFEVVKDENATGNTAVRTEDFRLIVGDTKLQLAAHEFFKNMQ